jgi:hypothetical protein
VFRDCQVKALEAQAQTRAVTKVGHSEEKTGQAELFHSLHEMSGNEATRFLDAERNAARENLSALAPPQVEGTAPTEEPVASGARAACRPQNRHQQDCRYSSQRRLTGFPGLGISQACSSARLRGFPADLLD